MNRQRFLRNGILASIVGLLLRGVSLAFAAYVSRAVGAEGVGLNTLILSAYGFALTFASSGIGLTVTRLVASHMGEGREDRIAPTLRGAFLYSIIFSLSASLILASFSRFFAETCLGDSRATLPLSILSLSLVPTALSGLISGYFIARRAVIRNSAVQLTSQVLRIGITVLLLFGVRERGVVESVLALCIGCALSEAASFVIALILFLIDRIGERGRGARGISLLPVAETALPLALSSYVRSGLLSVEHGLIPKRLKKRGDSSSEALSSFGALHGMALPMVVFPMTPLSSFASLLMPEFAEAEGAGKSGRMSRIAALAMSATLAYAILAAALLFVFSEELGYAVYGSYSSGYFISVLAPVVPIMYLDHVVDSMLKGVGEQVYSMWINILDSALSVVLVWFLIPVFGIEGYAAVIILMEAFNFSFSLLRLRRRVSIRLDLVEAILIPLVSALGAALAVRALFVFGSSTSWWILGAKLLFSVCAFAFFAIPMRAIYRSRLGRKRAPEKNKERIAEYK